MRSSELTPETPAREKPDAVRLALDGAVSRRLPGRTIDRVERRLAPYRSSRWLEYVTVHLDDGAVVPLVYKDAMRTAPGSRADRVKPRAVMDLRREAWVYRHVLEGVEGASGSGGAPKTWAILVGRNGRPRGLVLERIEGAPLSEVGSPRAWKAAAEWLADFHQRRLPGRWRSAPLLLHDRVLHEGWLERAEGSGAFDRLEPVARERLVAAHGFALDLALSGPVALLHGEFYPSNVIVRRGPGGWTVHPVDWEMTGPGPAILDLAALTAGAWDPKERRTIALVYRRAARAATTLSSDDFLACLTAGRLLLAVQWLGWAEQAWTPPAQHRTDWLGTALECAEELS